VVVITEGRTRETTVVRGQHFAPGTIVVFDRGYLNLTWFAELTAAGVLFVTRLRPECVFRIVEARPIPQHRAVCAELARTK
jgi:putative transposase